MHLLVHRADIDQEFPPQVVAVATQQGIVEIEQGHGHGFLQDTGWWRPRA